jgi:hypothetical protein
MGGFCRQNSLENPPLTHDANACDWNPSLFEFELVGMRDPKYPRSITANTTVERETLNFIGFCCCALAYKLNGQIKV